MSMQALTSPIGFYADAHFTSEMRADLQQRPEDALRRAAREFEALFLQMVLKSARTAAPDGGDLLGGGQVGFYRELHEQQLASTLARGERLGIADMIVRQLTAAGAAAAEQGAAGSSRALMESSTAVDQTVEAAVPDPRSFVRSLWPHAVQAGESLGIAPEAIVAHAALESGWGEKVPRLADGTSTWNLFGIKADPAWRGASVNRRTLEHEDGRLAVRREAFRAYGTTAESVADYVSFLRQNPRYHDAVQAGFDSERYFDALQRAGYATDPDYARKLSAIRNGQTFVDAVATMGPWRP